MPRELFMRSAKPLESHVDVLARWTQQLAGGASLSRTLEETAGGLKVLYLAPPSPVRLSGAWMVGDAFVQGRDGAILEMTFFADDAGAAQSPNVSAAVRGILRSLAPGPRGLRSGPATRLEGCSVTLDLPEYATAYAERASDFAVCTIVLLADPGQRADVLVIYLGRHPQPAQAPDGSKAVAGRALGRELTWQQWGQARNPLRAEAFLKGLQADGLVAHLSATASSELGLSRLMQVAASSTVR